MITVGKAKAHPVLGKIMDLNPEIFTLE